MKVLWILNSPLPEALARLTGQPETSHSTGSWVCALADELCKDKDLQLYTAAPTGRVRTQVLCEGASVHHFLLPDHHPDWRAVFDKVCPDITHIHGTEYPFFLDFVKACGSRHVVVSLQGMVSKIAPLYFGGIPDEVLRRSTTMRDIIRKDTLTRQKRDILRRGKSEVSLLRSVEHVIGRTSWDRSVSLGINPDLNYHFCNEILREPFYSGRWEYPGCIRHRIFLSQGHYPLKGTHILLDALPAVLKRYLDTSVHIAGVNVMRGQTFKDKLLRNGYGRYLHRMVRDKGLADVVRFTGELDAEGIKAELLCANAFLSASVIENSPNSLCEAQMLGVPVIASDVGGVRDLVPSPSCGTLFSSGDSRALSDALCATFAAAPSFDPTAMRSLAAERHDRSSVIPRLKEIYAEIAG